MIMSAPFQGWVDHGFFNFQPTFYFDLAAFNGYSLAMLIYVNSESNELLQINNREHVSELLSQDALLGNGTLFAIMRKSLQETPFSTPMQGYYNRSVSQSVMDAWSAKR